MGKISKRLSPTYLPIIQTTLFKKIISVLTSIELVEGAGF
jgi:hypothetical protein